MNGSEMAITAREVTKRYRGIQALDRLTVAIPRDRVTVLLGRNGAGKSTLLRLCLGVEPAQGGEIRVLGIDPKRCGAMLRERVGYVPDRPDVPPFLSLDDYLGFLAPLYPTFELEVARDRGRELGIPLAAPIASLSRGQAMLAMLIAATAHHPRLLLLDEPFAPLDPPAREMLLRALITEMEERGRTIVLSTHDLDVARRVADCIVVLERGCLSFAGAADHAGTDLARLFAPAGAARESSS
jgi:ABC-2 type transport system ATP-binding protein